ncbi:hypothetical protein EJD97_001313 [Solanum chilense]|uniref:Uncharacterized protein n=1 Tax=Solanum chilense TaxID=4083 RepID=A0A6N2AM78_SOLCI|nr:hypothetical protein EJD97_001313 [Solanum chilense]
MDWGFQEKTTNLQDGVTKGGCLPHVLHEGLVDHRTELRAYDSPKNWQKHKEKLYQQSQNKDNTKQDSENNKETEQSGKEENRDNGKQMATSTPVSTPKSKNKQSKQKSDSAKRRQNMLQTNDSDQGHEKREESCNKFFMMDDNQGLDIHPLLDQYMNPPSVEAPDKRQ